MRRIHSIIQRVTVESINSMVLSTPSDHLMFPRYVLRVIVNMTLIIYIYLAYVMIYLLK